MFSKGNKIWCGSTTNAFYSQQGCCSAPPSAGCSLTFWVDALSPSSLWTNGHVCERAGCCLRLWNVTFCWRFFCFVFPVWRPALSMGELDSWLKVHSISHFPRRCPHSLFLLLTSEFHTFGERWRSCVVCILTRGLQRAISMKFLLNFKISCRHAISKFSSQFQEL